MPLRPAAEVHPGTDQAKATGAVRDNHRNVESISDIFEFWKDCSYELDQAGELECAVHAMDDDTSSSAFSGRLVFL